MTGNDIVHFLTPEAAVLRGADISLQELSDENKTR